jgi:hypothetical protein
VDQVARAACAGEAMSDEDSIASVVEEMRAESGGHIPYMDDWADRLSAIRERLLKVNRGGDTCECDTCSRLRAIAGEMKE